MKNKKVILGVVGAIILIVVAVIGIRVVLQGQADHPPDIVTPDSENPTPNGEGEKKSIVLYLPDEQQESLQPVGMEVAIGSDQAVVDALVSAKALPDGSEVLSAKLTGKQLMLDMNMTFGNAVRSSGTAGETMMVYSLINTFAQCYGAENVMLTVEGGVLETGHQVYDAPITPDFSNS